MPEFVHLHVHTQYSILDGASPIAGVVARAKELGMPALAITDHGNMFGAREFHEAATKAGIKPIIGCEVYVVRNRREKDKDEKAKDPIRARIFKLLNDSIQIIHLLVIIKIGVGRNLVRIYGNRITEYFMASVFQRKTIQRRTVGLSESRSGAASN